LFRPGNVHLNNLNVPVLNVLRRIYGSICEEAVWRSRYEHNEGLYRLYEEADLVTTIKMTRLRWAGHVMRMQDNLPCKKITLDKPEGRRRVGRPNLRWIDEVTKNAEKLGTGGPGPEIEMIGGGFFSRPRPCIGCSIWE